MSRKSGWMCEGCARIHGDASLSCEADIAAEAVRDVQQNRVADLRGYAGQLRSALRDAYDNAPNGTVVHSILGNALAIPAPDSEAA